jgi:hypothetical protein
VDCILWLAELKSYSRVRRKFNQVHPNKTAPICSSVKLWDKRLKETGSVLGQHGPPRFTVSQDASRACENCFPVRWCTTSFLPSCSCLSDMEFPDHWIRSR